MTPCASETVSRLSAQLGSFKEARDALALLGCGRMSVEGVRDVQAPRRTPVQTGGNALAPPQRRMRLRHHRQTALRSMMTAAMDDYFFNEIKSQPV